MQFETETVEAEQIVLEIKRLIDTKNHEPKEIAILFRTNEQPRLFETELRKHKIPYVLIGGMSFFDRREVKDVLSLLQVIVKPDNDPALRRIINVPPRGISRQAIQKVAEAAQRLTPEHGDLLVDLWGIVHLGVAGSEQLVPKEG